MCESRVSHVERSTTANWHPDTWPAVWAAAKSAATVAISFDLVQSLDARGFCIPDDEDLARIVRAFEDWLWYEVEQHWHDIVATAHVELVDEKGGPA